MYHDRVACFKQLLRYCLEFYPGVTDVLKYYNILIYQSLKSLNSRTEFEFIFLSFEPCSLYCPIYKSMVKISRYLGLYVPLNCTMMKSKPITSPHKPVMKACQSYTHCNKRTTHWTRSWKPDPQREVSREWQILNDDPVSTTDPFAIQIQPCPLLTPLPIFQRSARDFVYYRDFIFEGRI